MEPALDGGKGGGFRSGGRRGIGCCGVGFVMATGPEGDRSDPVEFGILPAQAVDQWAVVGLRAGDALDQVGGPKRCPGGGSSRGASRAARRNRRGRRRRRGRPARPRPRRRAAPRRGCRGCRWGSSRTGRPPQWTSCRQPSASLAGDDAEVLPVLLVPRAGQVADGQIAGQQRLLQLEAEDDVQVVGHLVGLGRGSATARRG